MRDIFKTFGEQLGLFKKEMPGLERVDAPAQEINRDEVVCDDGKSFIYERVLYNLDIKKVYLDPTLSLIKFSSIVGTNTTYLSNTINRNFGCNFKTLINKYRVEACKVMLGMKELSVKDVACRSGFSSVSAFYASFKKATGVSPVVYRTLVLHKEIGSG